MKTDAVGQSNDYGRRGMFASSGAWEVAARAVSGSRFTRLGNDVCCVRENRWGLLNPASNEAFFYRPVINPVAAYQ